MKCKNHSTCKGYAADRSRECRECLEVERPAQDKRALDLLETKPRRVADVWGRHPKWDKGKRKP